MEIKTVSVTPAMARSYLAQNSHNRKLATTRVMTLAAMMRSGSWVLNGETIIISKTGQLLDGQHRLAAVVEYGRPVEMLVATGAPENAFNTINTGASRSSSDILSINGVANTTAIAAAAGLLWRMFHPVSAQTKIPPTYIVEIVKRYPEFERWVNRSDRCRKLVSSAAILSTMVYLDRIANRPDIAMRLFEGLLTGESLSAGDPILALRNRLINMRGSGHKTTSRNVWVVLIRTISALESGENLHKFKYTGTTNRVDRPDMFDVHIERLSANERLLDLLPPSSTGGRKNLQFLKVAA